MSTGKFSDIGSTLALVEGGGVLPLIQLEGICIMESTGDQLNFVVSS